MNNDKYEDSEITEDCFLELEDLCWDLDEYFQLANDWKILEGDEGYE